MSSSRMAQKMRFNRWSIAYSACYWVSRRMRKASWPSLWSSITRSFAYRISACRCWVPLIKLWLRMKTCWRPWAPLSTRPYLTTFSGHSLTRRRFSRTQASVAKVNRLTRTRWRCCLNSWWANCWIQSASQRASSRSSSSSAMLCPMTLPLIFLLRRDSIWEWSWGAYSVSLGHCILSSLILSEPSMCYLRCRKCSRGIRRSFFAKTYLASPISTLSTAAWRTFLIN